MKRKRKKNYIERLSQLILPLAITVFLVTLFAIFWTYIIEHKWYVLAISGAIITLFFVLGTFNWKKFKKGLKRRF